MITNRFYKLILFGSLFFFSLYANAVTAKTIDDVNVPETVQVQGEVLKLNGAGIREKFLLDIYVGALYLKKKTLLLKIFLRVQAPNRSQCIFYKT